MTEQRFAEVIPATDFLPDDHEVVDSRTGDCIAVKCCRGDAEALAAELNALYPPDGAWPTTDEACDVARGLRITGAVV